MLEKGRWLSAAGFASAMLMIAFCIEPADRYGIRPGQQTGRGRQISRFRQMLVLMLLLGMLVFTVRYAEFGYAEKTLTWSPASQGDINDNRHEDNTVVTGRVLSCVPSDDKLKIIVRSVALSHPKILVTIKDPDMSQDYTSLTGAVIEVSGRPADIPSADNPGCFDYRRYLRGRGISVSLKTSGFRVISEGAGLITRLRHQLYRAREDFISRFDDETSGFIRGVIFGDKRDIDDELIDEFNQNSTGHILAVSGLHMGFLFGLLKLLTGRRRTAAVSVLVISVLWIYGEMTMWSAATIRACLVASASIISLHLKRRFDLLTSVCLAAVCILFKEPYQLFDAGFQLSFLAMAGISFLTGPLSHLTGKTVGAALAVQLGTVPAAVFTFNCFEPFALFINIPMILLASVLVPLCIIMLMLELAAGFVPAAGVDLAELIAFAVIRTNHMLASGTCDALRTAGLGTVLTVLYYLLLFGLSSEYARVMILRRKRRELIRLGALMLIPVVMLSSCLFDRLADDEVVFAAVGQGDCTHIRAADRNILIDGGGVSEYGNKGTGKPDDAKKENGTDGTQNDNSFNVGEKILMPYLLHSGAASVDMALVTHLHADHYKGITELTEVMPVGAIGIPIDYRSDSEEIAGSYDPERIIYIKPDTRIDITKDVYIEVLWPLTVSDKPLAADDPNEHNTVYMIHYSGIKVMVTGDLLEEDELEMVKHYEGTDSLKCDVLKVAHHGSKSSSSEAFLDAAAPSVAVIQVGRNNLYGHPHARTLERLEARGIRVFRTDLNGAVGIDIHGDDIAVDLYKGYS